MEYSRSTREATLTDLDNEIRDAIVKHSEKYELGEISADTIACIETISLKKKKGLFGGKTETYIAGIILTSGHIVWGTKKNNEAPSVISARLSNIQVQDYERSEMYRLVQDSGINILGLKTDSADAGSVFIGLGNEAAALDFKEKLKRVVVHR